MIHVKPERVAEELAEYLQANQDGFTDVVGAIYFYPLRDMIADFLKDNYDQGH